MDLTQKLEAILFWKGEEVSVADLAKLLKTTPTEIEAAVKNLQEHYRHSGLVITNQNNTVAMVTAAGASALIEDLTREELDKDLGKAGLETLTIVVYKGPLSRSEIDYIRGVNSSFIIRHLLVRGLIERVPSPKDSRIFLYQATTELVKYLGVSSVTDLPEYQNWRQNLTTIPKDNAPD